MTCVRFVTYESITTPKFKTMESFISEIKGRGVLMRTCTGAPSMACGRIFGPQTYTKFVHNWPGRSQYIEKKGCATFTFTGSQCVSFSYFSYCVHFSFHDCEFC